MDFTLTDAQHDLAGLAREILTDQVTQQRLRELETAPDHFDRALWTDLAEAGVLAAALPVVSIGERLAGAPAAGEVLFDNRAGVRCALEHLHALGHGRIAVLRPPGSPTNDRPAELFVVAEADRLSLEVQVVTARYELREATELASALLTAVPRPTAVFCFSDSIAYGVYAAARELDIAIPEELSVIGYDDHPISTLLSPPLTSFSWGSKRLVEVAVQMLLAAMEGDPSVRRRVVIAPELRERGSTTPPGA